MFPRCEAHSFPAQWPPGEPGTPRLPRFPRLTQCCAGRACAGEVLSPRAHACLRSAPAWQAWVCSFTFLIRAGKSHGEQIVLEGIAILVFLILKSFRDSRSLFKSTCVYGEMGEAYFGSLCANRSFSAKRGDTRTRLGCTSVSLGRDRTAGRWRALVTVLETRQVGNQGAGRFGSEGETSPWLTE